MHINDKVNNQLYNCIVCDNLFIPSIKKQMFCSADCKAVVDASRRSLDILHKIATNKQPLCRECGTILSKPESIKRGFCRYECAANHRKRPGHSKKLTVNIKDLTKSCCNCYGLLRERKYPTKWGFTCSEACTLTLNVEGGPKGVENRYIHITQLKGDNNQTPIKNDHIVMYNRMNARRNIRYKSQVTQFMLPTVLQSSILAQKYKMESKWHFKTGKACILVEVPIDARLISAAYNNSTLGLEFLIPILGSNSANPVMVKRRFIYAPESYEYNAKGDDAIVARWIACTGNSTRKGHRLYETTTRRSLEYILELQENGKRVVDFEPRFAGQLFNDKELRKQLPGFEAVDEDTGRLIKSELFNQD